MASPYRNSDRLAQLITGGADVARAADRSDAAEMVGGAVPVALRAANVAGDVHQAMQRADTPPSRHEELMGGLRRISALANAAGVPVSVAIMSLVEDPEERRDYLNLLGTLLTALNAPVLVSQGQQAVQHARDPESTPPPSGTEALARALPMIAMLLNS